MSGPRMLQDDGFEEGVVVTLDDDAHSRATPSRRKTALIEDEDEHTLPDCEPPGWAEPE